MRIFRYSIDINTNKGNNIGDMACNMPLKETIPLPKPDEPRDKIIIDKVKSAGIKKSDFLLIFFFKYLLKIYIKEIKRNEKTLIMKPL